MAGFTFNGCGASDSYYPIKNIGEFNCPCCGNTMQKFSLMELRMKIRVFFIPTVTVNTKYAVACNKCKNGYYVDETQKNNILSGKVNAVVTKDGVVFENIEQKIIHTSSSSQKESVAEPISEVAKVFDNKPDIAHNNDLEMEQTNKTEVITESKREKAQRNNEIQNTIPKLDVGVSAFAKRVVKICPHCQMMYNESKEKCTVCGRDLEIRK